MKQKKISESSYPVDEEASLALDFYTQIMRALRSSATRRIVILLSPSGQLKMGFFAEKNLRCNRGSKD